MKWFKKEVSKRDPSEEPKYELLKEEDYRARAGLPGRELYMCPGDSIVLSYTDRKPPYEEHEILEQTVDETLIVNYVWIARIENMFGCKAAYIGGFGHKDD